mmetsp:Transcript_71322/g.163484  ORF Transcript_71322/g.163484 Transcript_71322/m.163484 type:complete len:290 (+) Transcript_71322:4914-5783(+)
MLTVARACLIGRSCCLRVPGLLSHSAARKIARFSAENMSLWFPPTLVGKTPQNGTWRMLSNTGAPTRFAEMPPLMPNEFITSHCLLIRPPGPSSTSWEQPARSFSDQTLSPRQYFTSPFTTKALVAMNSCGTPYVKSEIPDSRGGTDAGSIKKLANSSASTLLLAKVVWYTWSVSSPSGTSVSTVRLYTSSSKIYSLIVSLQMLYLNWKPSKRSEESRTAEMSHPIAWYDHPTTSRRRIVIEVVFRYTPQSSMHPNRPNPRYSWGSSQMPSPHTGSENVLKITVSVIQA